MPELQPNFQPGDVLAADTINELIRRSQPIEIRSGQGVNVRRAGHQIQISRAAQDKGSVCVTTSTITARSGLTPGQGSVELYTFDDSSGDLEDTGISIDPVYSFSSTTGGIPSGTYGWVSWDNDGTPWFTSEDCGN